MKQGKRRCGFFLHSLKKCANFLRYIFCHFWTQRLRIIIVTCSAVSPNYAYCLLFLPNDVLYCYRFLLPWSAEGPHSTSFDIGLWIFFGLLFLDVRKRHLQQQCSIIIRNLISCTSSTSGHLIRKINRFFSRIIINY